MIGLGRGPRRRSVAPERRSVLGRCSGGAREAPREEFSSPVGVQGGSWALGSCLWTGAPGAREVGPWRQMGFLLDVKRLISSHYSSKRDPSKNCEKCLQIARIV